MSRFLSRLIPLFDGGEGGGGTGAGAGAGGAGGEGAGGTGGAGSGTGEGAGEGSKTFTEAETQAKIDAAIKDRLAREKKKTDASLTKLQKQLDELSGKAPAAGEGGAAEAGTEVAEAVLKAENTLKLANQRIIDATAQTEAIKLGIDPKYIADAVRLADLSAVEIGEDGKIDNAKISKALADVLTRMPTLKAAGQEGQGGGFKVGGSGGGQSGATGWKGKQQSQGQGESAGKRWNRWN